MTDEEKENENMKKLGVNDPCDVCLMYEIKRNKVKPRSPLDKHYRKHLYYRNFGIFI
jgi:hypothetical protein